MCSSNEGQRLRPLGQVDVEEDEEDPHGKITSAVVYTKFDINNALSENIYRGSSSLSFGKTLQSLLRPQILPVDSQVSAAVEPEYVQQSTFCWGLCCLRGCVMGVVGMLYFFVVLPTGVLLVFHGVSKRRSFTLNLGVGILCVPTFLVIVTILLLKFCYVTRKDRRTEKAAKKRTLAFENPLSRRRPGDEDVCSSMC